MSFSLFVFCLRFLEFWIGGHFDRFWERRILNTPFSFAFWSRKIFFIFNLSLNLFFEEYILPINRQFSILSTWISIKIDLMNSFFQIFTPSFVRESLHASCGWGVIKKIIKKKTKSADWLSNLINNTKAKGKGKWLETVESRKHLSSVSVIQLSELSSF